MPQRVIASAHQGSFMTDYKKLSELYAELDKLLFMRHDILDARENLQTKDHIFELDISPRINSRSLSASKIEYKEQLLYILDGEIKKRQQIISQLSSK